MKSTKELFTCFLTPVLVQPGEGVARLDLSVRTLSQAIELSNKVLENEIEPNSLLGNILFLLYLGMIAR